MNQAYTEFINIHLARFKSWIFLLIIKCYPGARSDGMCDYLIHLGMTQKALGADAVSAHLLPPPLPGIWRPAPDVTPSTASCRKKIFAVMREKYSELEKKKAGSIAAADTIQELRLVRPAH